jgi:hypothetical protein
MKLKSNLRNYAINQTFLKDNWMKGVLFCKIKCFVVRFNIELSQIG